MNLMANANAYEKYKQQGVMTASPVDLVIILYDGCIKQIKLARLAFENKNYEGVNTRFQRAQDIIMELIMSLDLHFPISGELMKLYEFMLNQLVDINMSKDIKRVQPILEMLESLREAWVEIRRQQPVMHKIED